MKFIDPTTDPWQYVAADEPAPAPAAHRLLTLTQWQAVREGWPADLPVGVRLANNEDVELLEADLPRLSLLVLEFPKWTDGRAYSQAHLLRARWRFQGEVRATGAALVDMLPLLSRTGFDAVQLRDGQDLAAAERALHFFDDAALRPSHYQGDVAETRPLFARAAA